MLIGDSGGDSSIDVTVDFVAANFKKSPWYFVR